MEDDELSDFDKGQVVAARELGLSVSKTAKTVGCSRAAVVKAYRQWYEEGLRLRAGRPRLFDPKALDDDSGSESEQTAGEEDSGEKKEEQEPEPTPAVQLMWKKCDAPDCDSAPLHGLPNPADVLQTFLLPARRKPQQRFIFSLRCPAFLRAEIQTAQRSADELKSDLCRENKELCPKKEGLQRGEVRPMFRATETPGGAFYFEVTEL
ncbi:uncharacterized protein LOC111609236 isoform X1 [Xiphophorus maculatus]|uniref:uncharacterized protein LOC111609236 isoform X1 n=1 Tax=Xiphophorus maculatus TaxID=8083 RepID=UPI000C6D4D3E|nr:uncharacterized protein LOC111609236 isoform X1 [Xiphophorus maculatus]